MSLTKRYCFHCDSCSEEKTTKGGMPDGWIRIVRKGKTEQQTAHACNTKCAYQVMRLMCAFEDKGTEFGQRA